MTKGNENITIVLDKHRRALLDAGWTMCVMRGVFKYHINWIKTQHQRKGKPPVEICEYEDIDCAKFICEKHGIVVSDAENKT